MEFEQQELLKALMRVMDTTREYFCEAYEAHGVTLRALNTWLLPSGSKGFRRMPEGIYQRMYDDLLGLSDCNFGGLVLKSDTPNSQRICFERNGVKIIFPDIWLFDGYYDVSDVSNLDDFVSDDKELAQLKSDGKNYTFELSLDSVFDNPNFIMQSKRTLTEACLLGGKPYFLYVMHYRTAKEALAAMEGMALTNDDVHLMMACEVRAFNGGYFAFSMKLAPEWYQFPLIIYYSKGLVKFLDGSIIVDYWEHVIDENGQVIAMPDMPNKS